MPTTTLPPHKGHSRHTVSDSDVACATEMDIHHDADTSLREELDRLAAANRQIMGGMDDSSEEMRLTVEDAEREVAFLRSENRELRLRLDQLELQQRSGASGDWQDRQREYETLLDEKTEAIRTLHLHIQELQELLSQATAPAKPDEKPLDRAAVLEENEDVRRMKRELEDQRKQLEEDELSLMEQMRQMELTMARERAEMARQKTELSRLNSELAREIEMASRDGALRDRLAGIQRRHQEVIRGKPHSAPAAAAPQAPASPPKVEEEPKANGGLFKRFFG